MATHRPVRYKILSAINLGGQEIRFLGVNEDNSAVHFPNSVDSCPGRLLFLASDVLTASSISKKNHIRVHTRYAKSGFAAKLRLTGFKIEGINNSGVMWFYSIQGLFKVVFELHNSPMQRDCLSLLQSVWMSRYNEPRLAAEGVLRYNMRLKLSNDSFPGVPPIQRELDCSEVAEDGEDEEEEEGNDNTSEGSIKPSRIVEITEEISAMLEAASYLDSIDGSAQDNLASDLKDSKDNTKVLGAGEFVEQLISFVQTSISTENEISQHVICQILLTLDYLKHITSLDAQEGNLQWGTAFFTMMEEFLLLVKSGPSELLMKDSLFGLPWEQYILLQVVSDWLGKEFNKLESKVAEEVELFKKQNLDCIGNLPPPEVMVNTLFPRCMKTLIVNWLGGGKIEEPLVNSDHTYTPPVKVQRLTEPEGPNYQLVQLILEFTTNCLISGIAHVVYSRINLEKSAAT